MSILITGAASGLGAALARDAAGRKEQIIGIDRAWREEEPGPDSLVRIRADLSDIAALTPLAQVIGASGPFSTVIHNAAVSASGPFETIPAAAHQKLIDINVTAPLLLTQNLLNARAIAKGGTIVFIASLSVQVGYPGAASYAASKAALANYAKSLRKALRADGIGVLTVYPGPLRTEQARRHAPKGADAEKRMTAQQASQLIWNAIDNGAEELVPGTANRLFAIAGKLAPGLLRKAMRKIVYEKLDGPVY